MKTLFFAFLLGIFSLNATVQARDTVPLINLENQAISASSGKPLSLADVARALRQAAPLRGWTIEEIGPGKALATLVVRNKHTIKVDISYTESTISFIYRDSDNMKYSKNSEGNPVIHPFYLKWVQNLVTDVRVELGRF